MGALPERVGGAGNGHQGGPCRFVAASPTAMSFAPSSVCCAWARSISTSSKPYRKDPFFVGPVGLHAVPVLGDLAPMPEPDRAVGDRVYTPRC